MPKFVAGIPASRSTSAKLPVPDAPAGERAAVAALAEHAQGLHTQRRARVEAFLRRWGCSRQRRPAATRWRSPGR